MIGCCRRYHDLEQDSVSYQAQKLQAEIAASALAERLQAVLQDKFRPSSTAFDSDTPIDKALSFLQSYIQVLQPGEPCKWFWQRLHWASDWAIKEYTLYSLRSLWGGLR